MIKVTQYISLPQSTKDQLNVFIHDEFGHVPIVKETEWAAPDWTIINYEDNNIASFYNIVERYVKIDGEFFKTGGLNNVMTPKGYRGKGYSSQALMLFENFIFEKLNCDFGILLCADKLIPFYKRFNWYHVTCPVNFAQSDGPRLWGANTMMMARIGKTLPSHIDLNGLPW